jgi:hypothetical protein
MDDSLNYQKVPDIFILTSRQEVLARAFLKYLHSADENVAGAREFQSLEADPDTCNLGDFLDFSHRSCDGSGIYLKIHQIQEGPGKYESGGRAIYELASGEMAVTYSWGDVAFLSGGGGTAHRRLRIGFADQLESIEREIVGIFMS